MNGDEWSQQTSDIRFASLQVDTGLDYRKSPSAVEPFGPNSTKTPADTKTFGNSSALPVKISANPDT